VKRFLQVATLLIIGLFVLVSGLDATLDHVARTPGQSSFTWYNEKGGPILAYSGDLSLSPIYAHPAYLHRTSTDELPSSSPRWF
jgi:hypothetical protein